MRQPDDTGATIYPLNVIQPYLYKIQNYNKNGTSPSEPPPTPTSESSQVFLCQKIDTSDLFDRLLNISSDGPTYSIDYEECLSDPIF
ncbi:hypothetical protein FQN57_005136 [Myotisia sp. PD_48]|nr:hypothetical protein FQN57_005136 [Myotisia sp. PD_48]